MSAFIVYHSPRSKKLKAKAGKDKFDRVRQFLEKHTDALAPCQLQALDADPALRARVLEALGPGNTGNGFWTWMETEAPTRNVFGALAALVGESGAGGLRCDVRFRWVDPVTRERLSGQDVAATGGFASPFQVPADGELHRSRVDFSTADTVLFSELVFPFADPADGRFLQMLDAIEATLGGPYFHESGFQVCDRGRLRKAPPPRTNPPR